MLCSACQKEVAPQAAFCASCGTPVQAAPANPEYTAVPGYTAVPSYATAPPQGGAAAAPSVAVSSGLSDKTAAALSYVTIIPAILFLVLDPYNRVPLIRFHSWQSIFLFIGAVVVQLALSMLHVMLRFIPLIWILFILAHFIVAAGLFVLWVIAILKASRGEWYKIPGIGDFAERQARGL